METLDQTAIQHVEQQLLTAIQTKDFTLLDELLHDDLLFVIPTGQTVTKAMDLENLKSGNLVIESMTTTEQQISRIADTAVVSVVVQLKGTYLGQPIDNAFKYIRTWNLFGQQWKVIGGAGVQV